MKYNININQKALAESGLDLIDCAILDWLIIICNSKNQAIQDKRMSGLTWVDYKTLLKDMPLLKIKSPSALTPRFKKIEKSGYIKCQTKREGSVTKMYVSLEKKIDSLFIEINKPSSLVNTSIHNKEHEGALSVHDSEAIINTNIHHNISDNNVILVKENSVDKKPEVETLVSRQIDMVIKCFEKINPACNKYYGDKTQRTACKAIIETYGFDKVRDLIENTLPDTNGKQYYPVINKPTHLQDKWSSLDSALKREGKSSFKPWVGTSGDDYNKKSIIMGGGSLNK